MLENEEAESEIDESDKKTEARSLVNKSERGSDVNPEQLGNEEIDVDYLSADHISNEGYGSGEDRSQRDSQKYSKTSARARQECKSVSCDYPGPIGNCTEPIWRIYMSKFAKNARDRMEKAESGVWSEPKDQYFPRLPNKTPPDVDYDPPCCNRITAFNTAEWKKRKVLYSKEKEPTTESSTDKNAPCPNLRPSAIRDYVIKDKIKRRKQKMREEGALECDIEKVNSPGISEDEEMERFDKMKELVSANIPVTELKNQKGKNMVDACCGPKPGLVFGDYIYVELYNGIAFRSLAYVCLHGLTGMAVSELERAFPTAWKFDMYQAVVALAAKTQLKYKYVWSPNIDYIYNTAWHIFVHVGFLDSEKNLRFDDVLIYNYVYSVELEMVDEFKDMCVTPDISFKFFEKSLVKVVKRTRKDYLLAPSYFGKDKEKDTYDSPVHELTADLERWFDKLDPKYTNCVLKTPRFAVAFWKDGFFWYLYNPYRCDKLGFFAFGGYACLSKHCSKDALKRHLMILILRAYAFSSDLISSKNVDKKSNKSKKKSSSMADDKKSTKSKKSAKSSKSAKTTETGKDTKKSEPTTSAKSSQSSLGSAEPKEHRFYVRVYQLVYHSCDIHNDNLYLRKPPEESEVPVTEEQELSSSSDLDAGLSRNHCGNVCEKDDIDDIDVTLENPNWLLTNQMLWIKKPKKLQCPNDCSKKPKGTANRTKVEKWHNFEVLKPHGLYVLWGDTHITDSMFTHENRYHQAAACYAVCAGMIQVNVPEYWSSETLDAIVVCGDRFYTHRKGSKPDTCESDDDEPPGDPEDMEWDDRPNDYFQISGFYFELEAFPERAGRLYTNSDVSLWKTLQELFLEHKFGILYCDTVQVGIFKQYGAYYILDVRSYGPPVYQLGNAGTYLLRATSFLEFVTSLVVMVGSAECLPFKIRPINIKRCIDQGSEDAFGRPRCPDFSKCGPERLHPFKDLCPEDGSTKKCGKKPKPLRPRKLVNKTRRCCPNF